MRTLRRSIASALFIASAPITLAAQAFAGTGIASNVSGGLDSRWEVSCRALSASRLAVAPCNSTTASPFSQASVITATPFGWADVPLGPNGVRYIGALPSGSVGNSNGEDASYEYTFRTTFFVDAGDVSRSQLELSPMRIDNYWVGFTLNGGALQTGAITPTPLPPNGGNWTTPFSMIINSGFVAGVNTLEITVSGNGKTDGLLVDGRVNVVPEPSTYALMATGLVGVVGVARRRRNVTA
jgi:hypothetical protein